MQKPKICLALAQLCVDLCPWEPSHLGKKDISLHLGQNLSPSGTPLHHLLAASAIHFPPSLFWVLSSKWLFPNLSEAPSELNPSALCSVTPDLRLRASFPLLSCPNPTSVGGVYQTPPPPPSNTPICAPQIPAPNQKYLQPSGQSWLRFHTPELGTQSWFPCKLVLLPLPPGDRAFQGK